MPFKVLIGPIAAATIVTAFWFAAMWRGHQIERGGGKLPRRYEAAFYAYLGALGLTYYLIHGRTLATGPEIFGAALLAEGLGIVVTYALVQALAPARGAPWKDRAVKATFAVILTGGLVAAVLTT